MRSRKLVQNGRNLRRQGVNGVLELAVIFLGLACGVALLQGIIGGES